MIAAVEENVRIVDLPKWIKTRENSAFYNDPERGVRAWQAASTTHLWQDCLLIIEGMAVAVGDAATGKSGLLDKWGLEFPEPIKASTNHIEFGRIACSKDINSEDPRSHLFNPGAIASRVLLESVQYVADFLRVQGKEKPKLVKSLTGGQILYGIWDKFNADMKRILAEVTQEELTSVWSDYTIKLEEGGKEFQCVDCLSNLALVMDIGTDDLFVIVIGDSCAEIQTKDKKIKRFTRQEDDSTTDSFRAVVVLNGDAEKGKGNLIECFPPENPIIRTIPKSSVERIIVYTDGNTQVKTESGQVIDKRETDDLSVIEIHDPEKFFG